MVLPPDWARGADGPVGEQVAGAVGGGVGEEEEAAWGGPEGVEGFVVFKMGGASGQKEPNHGPLTRPLTRWTGWRCRRGGSSQR